MAGMATMHHVACQHQPGAVLAIRSHNATPLTARRHAWARQRRVGQSHVGCRGRGALQSIRASSAASVWSEDDVAVFTEKRTAPPKLPAPPKSASLLSVMPYLVKLATSDRRDFS